MKAIAYCRVSTEERESGTHSLEEQESQIRQYCAEQGIEVADCLAEEAGIGLRDKHPALDQLIDGEVPEGIEALVVSSTDRIAGNVKRYLFVKQELSEAGLTLLCAEDNSGEDGAGKFAPMLGRA